MKKFIISLLVFIPAITLGLILSRPASHSVQGANGADFKPGNIIHNAVFTAKDSMSTSQIQSFLNGKVPVCDTNGTKPSEYGGPDTNGDGTVTRAEYGTSKGSPPPYICLKNYTENSKTAAQIIYEKAQQFAISPKTLIVLLQKEQGLVTDDWPWPFQYRTATGYGCPDGAACDSQYYGFTNQVHNAARMFRKIIDQDPNWFTPYRVGTNTIKWHPNSACGTSQVSIVNTATVALYSYTPYRPNQAALSNLYGTGNSCSSYGNRNFWRDFVDWFGSTHATKPWAWSLVGAESYTNSTRTTRFTSEIAIPPESGIAYLRVRALNLGYQNWEKSFIRMATEGPKDRSSQFYNSDWLATNRAVSLKEDVVKPGEIGTFEFTIKAPNNTGSYRERFNIVAEGKSWLNDVGLGFSIDVVTPVAASSPAEKAQLAPTTELNPGQFIISRDRHSIFILQSDGNLVLYRDGKAAWNSQTAGKAADRLIMQGDGNLVLYDTAGKPLWHTRTNGNSGAYLSLQTDGNLVIYNGSTPLWFTGTVHIPNHLSHVVRSIASTAIIYPGQTLDTADRRFKLVLQSDGNLVLYSPNRATWHSRTAGKSVSYLRLQNDGNLVLYDTSGRALWHTKTGGQGPSTLILQTDGNLVLYNKNNRPIWQSRTNGIE